MLKFAVYQGPPVGRARTSSCSRDSRVDGWCIVMVVGENESRTIPSSAHELASIMSAVFKVVRAGFVASRFSVDDARRAQMLHQMRQVQSAKRVARRVGNARIISVKTAPACGVTRDGIARRGDRVYRAKRTSSTQGNRWGEGWDTLPETS